MTGANFTQAYMRYADMYNAVTRSTRFDQADMAFVTYPDGSTAHEGYINSINQVTDCNIDDESSSSQ